MVFSVTLWRDEDGKMIVECPAIPGCVSQGDKEDALENRELSPSRDCREALIQREARSRARRASHGAREASSPPSRTRQV